MGNLLPPRALQGLSVGVSVSESEDLGRLGLSEDHLRLALAEVVRAVLIHGGRVVYGGHLSAGGYTSFLIGELERFGSMRCFTSVLPWSEHLAMPFAALWEARQRIAAVGSIICLDVSGQEIPVAQWIDIDRNKVLDQEEAIRGLTAMRRTTTSMIDARIVIGGKRKGFVGSVSGILEEIILAIENSKPIFLAGGFGGIAFDAADYLVMAPPDDLASLRPGMATHSSVLDPLTIAIRGKELDALRLSDGLLDHERTLLSVSHRASELASLVVTGLSRINHKAERAS